MLLHSLLMIAAVVAVLVVGLILYGRHAKDKTPMMRGGCTGDCANCGSRCDEDDKK